MEVANEFVSITEVICFFACFWNGIERIFSLSAYVALVVSFFLGSGPVLLLFCCFAFVAKRKSGWGICGSSFVGAVFRLIVLLQHLRFLYSLDTGFVLLL